jgi:type I restriction enzyme S subunit
MSWEKLKLGEVCILNYGKNLPASKRQDGIVPVYSSAGQIDFHSLPHVDSEGIIIGRKGSVGKIYFSDVPFFPIDTSYYIIPDEKYDLKFLYYNIQILGLEDLNSDAAVPGLNRNNAYSQLINIPPLETQKRIADILSAYDGLIENNLKRIKLLEQAAQNIYKEWFVNLRFPGYENAVINEETGLPVGWRKTKLGELVSLQQGFALNKKSRHHISEEVSKYPLLKISDLFKGFESLYVKDTIPKQFLVDKHEIIFSRTGQVGHAFMGRKGVVYNNCFRVKPNDKIDSLFLYQILIEPQFVSYVKGLATGAAQPDLNHGAFKSIEIVLPTRELQDKFSILKESNQTLKFNLIEQNTKLKAARDILLPRLMNRTIEV